jgi:hypothetical protein
MREMATRLDRSERLARMASWRDTASQTVQDDLDVLFSAVLPFAEQTLGKSGEMYPFGASIDDDGQVAMLAAALGLDDRPLSDDVLASLYVGAQEQSSQCRAFAFVADVRANGGDAVRVEVEHREGVALALLVPYARSRFKKTVTLGAMSVSVGPTRVWPS